MVLFFFYNVFPELFPSLLHFMLLFLNFDLIFWVFFALHYSFYLVFLLGFWVCKRDYSCFSCSLRPLSFVCLIQCICVFCLIILYFIIIPQKWVCFLIRNRITVYTILKIWILPQPTISPRTQEAKAGGTLWNKFTPVYILSSRLTIYLNFMVYLIIITNN